MLTVLAVSGCTPADRSAGPADRPAAPAGGPTGAALDWPGDAWPASTPEAQGLNGPALQSLDAEFASGRHGYIDAMLVIRHGRLVYERRYRQDYDRLFVGKEAVRGPYNYHDPDWHPWHQRGDLHTLQSVSKSVTSALIGIAIGRGEIPGVEVPMLNFFDPTTIAHLDDRKRRITLRDLLTMTAGFKWDEDTVAYTDPANSCAAMEASADWVRHVVDQPMEHDPGQVFRYNSGVTQILAHILFRATGRQADDYAREHLFGPLGISRFFWKRTPTGLPDAEGGLYLTGHDLARFGYLYLHDGVWGGKRILPEGWVAETMRPRAIPGGDMPPEVRYGYQWWLLPYGTAGRFAFTCLGYGGQRLLVIPEHDLVAVFNGWNIYDKPALDPRLALDRVLAAVP
jgi:CubicO group peptidase (beta-lactamase class C family)